MRISAFTQIIVTVAVTAWVFILPVKAVATILVFELALLLSIKRDRMTMAAIGGLAVFTGLMILFQLLFGSPLEVALTGGLRMLVMTMAFLCMLAATRIQDIAQTLVDRFHLPCEYAFMLTTALRFVPNFLADSEITLDAQSCRGYSNRGNCVKRLLSYVVVIRPLVMRAVAKSETLALSMELKEHKSSAIVYFTLRALVIVVMVLQIFNRNYENVFLCLLTLLLLVVPSLVQVTMKIELPTTLEIIILVFIFAAEILGEIQEFYILFPFWDTVLHTLNGFLAAAIGFSMVDLLNRSERMMFKLSPLFMAIVAFCFSMTIGVVWEFFEFGMDQLFHTDMQKDTIVHAVYSVLLDPAGGNRAAGITGITQVVVNGQDLGLGGYVDIGLIDTMKDLIVNFIGAVVFSVIGFFYVKNRGGGGVVGRFVPREKERKQDFLRIVQEEAELAEQNAPPQADEE